MPFCPLRHRRRLRCASLPVASWTFGVSGLLYNSDVLLTTARPIPCGRNCSARAISGPPQGQAPDHAAADPTVLGGRRKAQPATQVLSTNTGTVRPYRRNPSTAMKDSRNRVVPGTVSAPPASIPRNACWASASTADQGLSLRRAGQDRGRNHRPHRRYCRNHPLRPQGPARQPPTAPTGHNWRQWSSRFDWYPFHPATEIFRAGRHPAARLNARPALEQSTEEKPCELVRTTTASSFAGTADLKTSACCAPPACRGYISNAAQRIHPGAGALLRLRLG
ncbi:MAG: DUF3179 domain-containing protein [Sulfuritalea sp.]|nr:DUF3179 domain-containing protein [Sulfuritalea sp.]